ncbi:hypothetical protein [Streptomyces antibioticus]|uniref:hypothetical protein n=1 Tax=Streptomyces antibioticus TaxID=1890 RepID=UPI0036ACF123
MTTMPQATPTKEPGAVAVPTPSGRLPFLDAALKARERADERADARARALAAIEQAREGVGAEHTYLADYLTEGLAHGVDPQHVEEAAGRLVAACAPTADSAAEPTRGPQTFQAVNNLLIEAGIGLDRLAGDDPKLKAALATLQDVTEAIEGKAAQESADRYDEPEAGISPLRRLSTACYRRGLTLAFVHHPAFAGGPVDEPVVRTVDGIPSYLVPAQWDVDDALARLEATEPDTVVAAVRATLRSERLPDDAPGHRPWCAPGSCYQHTYDGDSWEEHLGAAQEFKFGDGDEPARLIVQVGENGEFDDTANVAISDGGECTSVFEVDELPDAIAKAEALVAALRAAQTAMTAPRT